MCIVASSLAVVSTLAGSGIQSYSEGIGSNAAFKAPTGLSVDASGNVFVADLYDNRIRKVTAAGGTRMSAVTLRACFFPCIAERWPQMIGGERFALSFYVFPHDA